MVTYPPEMLPSPDEGEDVSIVVDGIEYTAEAVERVELCDGFKIVGQITIARGNFWDFVS